MDETTNDPRQDLVQQSLASGAPPLNPFIPTAVSADTGSQSPFFVDAAKQAEEFNLTQQIQRGKAGVKFMGNQDQYEFFQNADVASNTLGNIGFEHTMKYSATASKGWGEQNTYGRDSWLRWMKGENSNYFWNPADLDDPSNQHNHSSWFSAVGEGIGKWFVDQSADAEFQDMKKQIETIDPTYTEDIRLQDTSDFLDNNLGVSRVLLAGGVNLYDYTRNTNNKLGLKFAINNAVIDSLQNVRLRKWDQNNQSFFGAGKLGDMLTYGIQDPLLVRDIVVTTALTLGLGTLQVGASRLAAGLGEVTMAGRSAMGVATTASKLLQFTSPLTGLVEGPVYKGLQTLIPNVGKSGIKTMMARGLAIGTETGIQGGLYAYQDQRNEYDWRNLIFQNPQSAFRPDWVGVAQGAATGFGAGGLMLGLMRFGLGALTGEARLLKSGKMKEYWQGVANSLDTWATTDKGLTVFGNELSNGRGVIFGNMIDKYLKNTVDDRDFASIMLNGSKMYSNATFSPEIAAKSGFDEKASAKIADAFAEATGLPGEIIQRYAPEHPVRLFFDNLMDPEYMDRTGLTYADTLKIFDAFKNKRAGLLGPSEVSLAGTTKAIQEIQSKENLVALAHVFELDRVHRIIQKSGLAFDTVAESFRKVTGQDLDFGVDNHRSNFAVVADYSVANSGLLQKHMDVLGFAKSGNKLRDYVNPDGLTIDGAVLRDSIRKTLDLDNRTGRLFVTDSYAGSEPNFIISIEPDGTMNRHATKLVIENSVVKPYNEVTKSPDYIPENIKTSQDMKESFGQLARDVKAVYEEKKAVRIAKAKDELKKISDIADSKSATPKEKATGEKVRKAWQDIGRLPTRTILEKHFNLSSSEAAAAEIVMETLGHDLEGMILKIAKSEKYLANNKMAAALQWERIESGVRALIRTGKHSDFGSLIHEMGHYNRAIFIGNTPENKAFRNKIGVSDELWKKFLKWCGNEDEIWLGSPEAMKLEELAKGGDKNAKAKLAEITKSEEKFATAWHHYVRSVMIGDGKTKATGLHRLFSAMGDHLGDLGKKMEMISTFEKELVMSPEAKEVFDKLFLRSQNNLTKFWDNANANIFKNMDPTERAKLGEYILGTELWNTHKAVTEIAAEKAAKVIDPVVKIKIIKTKMVDIIDGIKAKVSGSAFEPTKKSIHSSLKAGKTVEQIEGSITKARAMLNTPELFTAHGNRPPAPDSYFASHVRNLSDEQLQALPPGKVLQPIEGVVSWFHNDKTNELDVSFPVVTATKELIAKEIQRRQQSKAALKRLSDAVASRDKAAKVITGVETRVKAATTKPVKVENKAEASQFVANIKTALKNNSINELQVETIKQRLKGVVDKESGAEFNKWLMSHSNKAMGTLLELPIAERFSKNDKMFAEMVLGILEEKPVKVETPTPAAPKTNAEKVADDATKGFKAVSDATGGAFRNDTAQRLSKALDGRMTFDQFLSDAGVKSGGQTEKDSRLVFDLARQRGLKSVDGQTFTTLLAEARQERATVETKASIPAMKTNERYVPPSSLTKLKPSELAIPESTGKLGLLEVQKLEAADAEKAKFTSIGEADSTDPAMLSMIEAIRMERTGEERFKAMGEADAADPEMLALIEQARQERAIVETEAPILAKAISDSVEAAKEIAASELEVERTSITVVKENEEVTPETAIAEVKDSIDPRFVDESGTPVIGLTPEEKVVLEATQTLIDDAVTEEKQIAQIITNAADSSVPIAAIETTVVRVESPTINVNRISTPRVSRVIEPATVIVRALQVDADKAAAALPPEILMKVEEIDTLTIVRIDPKTRLELIKTILGSTTEDITDLPQLEKMLEKYFEARARASIAENALDKFGSLTEAENERWKAIPPKLLSDLEGDEEIDLIILHPEESSIPRRVAGRHNISVDDVMFVADIRKRRTQGLLAAADEVDTKEMARLEPSYRKNEQAKKLLEIEKNPTEIENLNKIIRATQADHGKYKAAAEKIINRELYGASTNKVQRISVHDETVKEIIKNGKPKNPVELIKENTDRQVRIIALRQALGLHTSWMDQDGRIAALGFNIFDSISDAKTGPSLAPVKMMKSFSTMVDGETFTKVVDINSARLIATNIVADILSGKSSLKTVEDLVVYYATSAYKKQAQLLSELTPDKPLALINNNPVLYHSILAILLEAEELDAAILKRLDPSKIVEELVEINRLVKETKITGTTAVKVERSISDVEFAHVLMHDNSFMTKVQRLVRKDEEVSPAEMIAKVYRTKSGIKNFFITRLGLDEKISDYDLLRAIQNWSNGKQPNTKLANSVRTVLDNLVKDSNKNSAKEISGEGVEDVSLGLLATTGEDLRVTKANMHHATVVDALMSLFYNYLEGKNIIDGGESMQDFFLARIASADPSQSQSTLSALKTMGIDINKNALVHRDEKLSAEIRSFFGDLVDDPEVGDGVKEVIKNNFGIGQKGTRESKAKGVVQGRTVDEWDQALDVRAMIFSEEIKNVDDVLEFISGNESIFSKLANELRTTARRDMKAVNIYPVNVKGPAPTAIFRPLITSILINDKKPYGFTPRIIIHEIIHSFTENVLSKIEQYEVFTGIKYLEVLQNFVDSSKGKAYNPTVELAEAYLEMVNSGNFKISKDKINVMNATGRVDDMEFYGSLNMHEMVSEAFSNPVFADRLHQVSSTSRADRSIFNKVFDAVIEMFGLKDKENITLLEKIVLATDDIVKKKQWTKEEKWRMLVRDSSGISSLEPALQKEINLSFETNRKQMTEVLTEIFKARDDLTSAKGRYNKSLGEVTQGRTLISTATEEPKFKIWFEDSKVVKSTSLLEESSSSEPMLMFHGSGSAGFDEFKGFDFSKHDPNDLLFGAGAYFTESPKLASSYAKPKKDYSREDFRIGDQLLLIGGQEDRISQYKKHITDKHALDVIEEYYKTWEIVELKNLLINLDAEGVSDSVRLSLAKAMGAEFIEPLQNSIGVYPVYLSIQKPIDADNAIFTVGQLKELAMGLKNKDDSTSLINTIDDWLPRSATSDDSLKFDFIFNVFKLEHVEHLFIQALMKDGYDGISHVGGLRRGKEEHRVFIAWKNTQIKSPFNKNFDPNVGSISGRTLGEPLDVLSDAVDLRRRKLASMGLHEETTMEDMNSIHRVLNGLDPIDTQTNKIFDSIKTPMNLSKATVISKAFAGQTYRSLSETERREFISSSLIPRIREAMGDRNSSAGIYSAASDTTFGKKVNSLIGGAIQYGDTADSNSILLQFISKIFDPMMDLRNGELKNKFNLPSIDKLNTEVNNLLLRSEMVQLRDKVLGRVKDQAELKRINDVAWDYMTRESEVPAMVNRDLVMETIKVQNKFNELTVDLLSKYGELSKNIDPKTYGTAHVANTHAHQNQGGFVEALTNHAVAKTLEKKQISVITASALGWLSIKRDAHTDNITSIKIEADSPLAVLLPEKEIGKRLEWKGSTIKLFNDIEKLSKDAQETHNKGLTSNEDYTADWNASYKKEGEEYTAIKQSMTIAKNRYLGIDFGDSKSSAPRRMSIGEGNNYAEERIISHDELVRNPELSQYFSKNIFQLANDQLRGSITDSMMTKYLSEFFGTRMSMSDLIQVLSGVGEESIGRSHLSASEIASRKRGYERLRSAWDHSIGNWTSSTDSVDKYYRVLLENSRVPLVAASGLRAAINSIPETARAILSSNKNRAMLTQALPNMVKMVQLIGPGGKNRRLARQQMISASHWLRGLSTDHMLHRASLHPDNPFAGAVFGQGAGGMISNFVNTWRAAGEMNKVETNWLQKASNRLSAFSSAIGAPLAFVNDVTTTLHIWNAQENVTTNIKEFRKMADLLAKNPTASYSEFGHLARKCGLAPKEALDLSTAGLLDPKYIDILHAASKNQSLYSDGMLDAKKLFTWAGDDQEKVEAINRMGSYINMTARHTNVEPTLLDIRVNQSIFGKSLSQYMQFMLSMGTQEIGRRRRTMTSGYSQHLAGLMLMEAMAYGSSRALADPVNDETGGYDEFVNNPTDFVIRTATSLPLLGSYAFLSQIMRHSIMGTSEFLGGPEASGKFNLPDLISGPASTAPSRLLRTPETIKSWYNLGHDVLGEMIQN
jgi:hypothetical protein